MTTYCACVTLPPRKSAVSASIGGYNVDICGTLTVQSPVTPKCTLPGVSGSKSNDDGCFDVEASL